jgi:hypothetical protein
VRFTPFFADQAEGPILLSPEVDNPQALQAGRMFALRDLGFLDVEPPQKGSSEFGPFRMTAAGRDAIARFCEPAVSGAAPARPIDTSWATI